MEGFWRGIATFVVAIGFGVPGGAGIETVPVIGLGVNMYASAHWYNTILSSVRGQFGEDVSFEKIEENALKYWKKLKKKNEKQALPGEGECANKIIDTLVVCVSTAFERPIKKEYIGYFHHDHANWVDGKDVRDMEVMKEMCQSFKGGMENQCIEDGINKVIPTELSEREYINCLEAGQDQECPIEASVKKNKIKNSVLRHPEHNNLIPALLNVIYPVIEKASAESLSNDI